MKTKMLNYIAAAFAVTMLTSNASAANVSVGVELALLVDVSGSVDSAEYALQKQGYINAFQNPTIQNLISTTVGGIAVTFIEWSGANQQSQTVGWAHLTDAASSNAFAAAITGTSRAFSGLTAPGSAINFATPLFTSNTFDGLREVIDVSGDGERNDGASTSAARDAALAAGVDRLNGLPIITNDFPNLDAWYAANIQGGANSFTLPASSFNTFSAAVERKLAAEITGGNPVPEGGPGVAMSGLMLLGLAGVHRKMVLRRKSC